MSNFIGEVQSSELILGVVETIKLLPASASYANGRFQLRLSGLESIKGQGTLVIEASTDLNEWHPVQTNATMGGILVLTDSEAGKFPARFYRAVLRP